MIETDESITNQTISEENKKDILWNEVGKMPSNSNKNNSEIWIMTFFFNNF